MKREKLAQLEKLLGTEDVEAILAKADAIDAKALEAGIRFKQLRAPTSVVVEHKWIDRTRPAESAVVDAVMRQAEAVPGVPAVRKGNPVDELAHLAEHAPARPAPARGGVASEILALAGLAAPAETSPEAADLGGFGEIVDKFSIGMRSWK